MTGRQLYDKLYRRFHRFLRLKAGGVSAAPPGTAAAAANASNSRRRKGDGDGEGDRRYSGGAAAEPARAGSRGGSGWVDDDDGDAEEFGGVQPCMGTGDDRDCPRTVRATSAWVAAGEVNRWGFRLRLVESSGYACSRCRWTEGCVGCFIRPDDEPCPVRAGDSVGVDWHISVIKVRAVGKEEGGRGGGVCTAGCLETGVSKCEECLGGAGRSAAARAVGVEQACSMVAWPGPALVAGVWLERRCSCAIFELCET